MVTTRTPPRPRGDELDSVGLAPLTWLFVRPDAELPTVMQTIATRQSETTPRATAIEPAARPSPRASAPEPIAAVRESVEIAWQALGTARERRAVRALVARLNAWNDLNEPYPNDPTLIVRAFRLIARHWNTLRGECVVRAVGHLPQLAREFNLRPVLIEAVRADAAEIAVPLLWHFNPTDLPPQSPAAVKSILLTTLGTSRRWGAQCLAVRALDALVADITFEDLRQALRSPHFELRVRCLQALARRAIAIPSDELTRLIEQLALWPAPNRDIGGRFGVAIASALERVADRSALREPLARIADRLETAVTAPGDAHIWSLDALARWFPSDAIPRIDRATKRPEGEIRRAAAVASGRLADPGAARDFLTQLCHDLSPSVRVVARMQYTRRFAEPAPRFDPAAAWRALTGRDDDVGAALESSVGCPPSSRRWLDARLRSRDPVHGLAALVPMLAEGACIDAINASGMQRVAESLARRFGDACAMAAFALARRYPEPAPSLDWNLVSLAVARSRLGRPAREALRSYFWQALSESRFEWIDGATNCVLRHTTRQRLARDLLERYFDAAPAAREQMECVASRAALAPHLRAMSRGRAMRALRTQDLRNIARYVELSVYSDRALVVRTIASARHADGAYEAVEAALSHWDSTPGVRDLLGELLRDPASPLFRVAVAHAYYTPTTLRVLRRAARASATMPPSLTAAAMARLIAMSPRLRTLTKRVRFIARHGSADDCLSALETLIRVSPASPAIGTLLDRLDRDAFGGGWRVAKICVHAATAPSAWSRKFIATAKNLELRALAVRLTSQQLWCDGATGTRMPRSHALAATNWKAASSAN